VNSSPHVSRASSIGRFFISQASVMCANASVPHTGWMLNRPHTRAIAAASAGQCQATPGLPRAASAENTAPAP
jgi:hypothetical protein